MNRSIACILSLLLVLLFLPSQSMAETNTTTLTLDEVLSACGINKGEFDQIEVKNTGANSRSSQENVVFILSNSEPEQGINRSAFVLVYDKDGHPIGSDSVESTVTRGSNLFRLENAGIAIGGYFYYDVSMDYTLGLNFYSPYQVDAKWTTLVSGADITPSRMTAAYTSVGDGYSSSNHSEYLGVKTNTASLSISNPAKAQRYSATHRPAYVMRFDAPPANYGGDLWGSELRVSATVNGQTYSAAVNVDPSWGGLS